MKQSLAVAYATKRKAKLGKAGMVQEEPVELAEMPESELDMDMDSDPVDVASIIKKHRFFKSKKKSDED